jgi:hypothetical protein
VVSDDIPPTGAQARDAAITIERDGIRIRAASDGPAHILLPVQFSHCLAVVNAAPIRLRRANLLQTLVSFDGARRPDRISLRTVRRQRVPSTGRPRQQGARAMSGRFAKAWRLPSKRYARRAVTCGYAIAYAFTLASFIVIWFSHSSLLNIGRDADLSLWLNKAYLDWARPFDVTAMNPMQGMTSMLMAMNPYLNPAIWVLE